MSDFQLNPEQSETIHSLSNFTNAYVLKGYAGTGKTTVITHWVQEIRKRPDDWPEDKYWCAPEIVLTAPTNKATGVLKDKAEEIKLPVEVKTIHSLLGLKMKWQNDKQILVKDYNAEDMFSDFDYVIIDEASMLSKELMNYIRDAQDSSNTKVIFMGDPCQLPPIGEKESESFTESTNLSELTTVMRQGKGNPIQDLALYLRGLILSNHPSYPNRLFEFIDNTNIFHIPAASYEDRILQAFTDAKETTDIRLVAWTNKVVDLWNDKIRDGIYGIDREEWTKGEAIVTVAPVIEPAENRIVFTTDTLLTIQREPDIQLREEIPCWKLWCKNKIIFVPTKSSGSMLAKRKKELLDAAKADKKNWRHFYKFMEAFANVKPAHSLTVHRSQGSTFDDVYVSYQNILSNPNRRESLQCLYVAITRPRSKLFLI